MRAISGREHGPRYATTASVSSAACESPRSAGRSCSRAHAAAAGDVLEHDPAAALAIAVDEQLERRFDRHRGLVRRVRELLDRERRRGDHEQRLDRLRERVGGVGGD